MSSRFIDAVACARISSRRRKLYDVAVEGVTESAAQSLGPKTERGREQLGSARLARGALIEGPTCMTVGTEGAN